MVPLGQLRVEVGPVVEPTDFEEPILDETDEVLDASLPKGDRMLAPLSPSPIPSGSRIRSILGSGASSLSCEPIMDGGNSGPGGSVPMGPRWLSR